MSTKKQWYWWQKVGLIITFLVGIVPASYGESSPEKNIQTNPISAEELDLNPDIINHSPVLQRWQHQVPNVLEEIKNSPSFRTRIRLGYSHFSSTDQGGGWNIGIEDRLIGHTGLTMSGDYQKSFYSDRQGIGADLHYYLRPLGSYINIAPVLGYRHLETDHYSASGINAGMRVLFVLSRGGAADVSFTQSWVTPATNTEVRLTTLSIGYAVTHNLRISNDIQKQHTREHQDNRVGVAVEWMP